MIKSLIRILAFIYLVLSGKYLKLTASTRVTPKKNRRQRRLEAYQRSHVWSEFWKGRPWYTATHELQELASKLWWESVERGEDHKRKVKNNL